MKTTLDEQELEQIFQQRIDNEQKIEPKDWRRWRCAA